MVRTLRGDWTMKILFLGDIVGPIGDESDWEAAEDPDLIEAKKSDKSK